MMRKLFLIGMYSIVFVLGMTGCGKEETNDVTGVTTEIVAVESATKPLENVKTEVTEEDLANTPSDTEVQENANPYSYEYNPCVIPEAVASQYDPFIVEAYLDFCKVVNEGGDYFICPDQETYCHVCEIVYNIHPFAYNLIDVPAFDESLIVDGKFPVNYKFPKDEYMEKLKAFQNEVTKIITSTLSEGDNELEKAIKLYGYFGPNMTYDQDLCDFNLAKNEGDCAGVETDYTTDNVIPEGYRAIMYKEGICHELASAYRYLLLQVGVEAIDIVGEIGGSAHQWNMVRIDGVYYHTDPTAQVGSEEDSLEAFCLSEESYVEFYDADISTFEIYLNRERYFEDTFKSDNRFSSLGSCSYYELDQENQVIYYGYSHFNGEYYEEKTGEFKY